MLKKLVHTEYTDRTIKRWSRRQQCSVLQHRCCAHIISGINLRVPMNIEIKDIPHGDSATKETSLYIQRSFNSSSVACESQDETNIEYFVQGAHAQQRRVSVQRWSRLDSGGDVGCVLSGQKQPRRPGCGTATSTAETQTGIWHILAASLSCCAVVGSAVNSSRAA